LDSRYKTLLKDYSISSDRNRRTPFNRSWGCVCRNLNSYSYKSDAASQSTFSAESRRLPYYFKEPVSFSNLTCFEVAVSHLNLVFVIGRICNTSTNDEMVRSVHGQRHLSSCCACTYSSDALQGVIDLVTHPLQVGI
jgi:hypothetical protein